MTRIMERKFTLLPIISIWNYYKDEHRREEKNNKWNIKKIIFNEEIDISILCEYVI